MTTLTTEAFRLSLYRAREPPARSPPLRPRGLDEATVLAEDADALHTGDLRRRKEVVERLRRRLAQELGIDVQVRLVEKKTLAGETSRVVYRRRL